MSQSEDVLNLNEVLSLIDVFRFTVRQNEASLLDRETTKLLLPQADSNTTTCPKTKLSQITCLDLSSKLVEKKVLDENETTGWDKIQQILFERLMIEDYSSLVQVTLSLPQHDKIIQSPNFLPNSPGNKFNPNDNKILKYLYSCFYRLKQLSINLGILKQQNSNSVVDSNKIGLILAKAERLILDQVILYLTEPDLFPDRDTRSINNQQTPQLLELVNRCFSGQDDTHMETVQMFVNSIGDACKDNNDLYEAIVNPSYAALSQKFVNMAIDDRTLQKWFNISRVFMQQPGIAYKFLEKNILKKDNSVTYQSTLLGFMLSISPLPRTSKIDVVFFNNPIRSAESDHKSTETQLGIKLQLLGQELHKSFHLLLKTPKTRNLFLSWIGRCLHTFKDRKKLWNNQVLMATTTISVNDGFLMNFFTVMLHLSEPFAGPYNIDKVMISDVSSFSVDKKMLKVSPDYCKWSRISHETSPVHFLGLAEETFLINSDANKNCANDSNTSDIQSNFISECFYGTHQAFTYAFRSVYERFFKLAQNINELQHAYSDALSHPIPGPVAANDPREMLKEKIDGAMNQFLNLKSVLMVPNRVAMQIHFCIATCAYLNHLVACSSFDEVTSAKEFKTITLSILREGKLSRVCLEYIPEMLVENVLDFFIFLKHFNEQALAQAVPVLEPLMTSIITFMGNSSLMQNPHLRARFAEILECLMPHRSLLSTYHRHVQSFMGCAELFENHPLIEQLVPSLVNVFVSIEMTGEGVQFEQKFSYRRPMYVVMEYLWEKPMHKRILIQMAQEAEENIDSSRPPLFLRFINLLMNDAIFLLDEALNYMNQLKEAEKRRRTEEWQRLSLQQRAQAEASYSHIGRLARFHNVLSISTIGTIAWITTEIKTIFSHPALVDRIANMLNYFLEHLVGPKKGKFNVNDKNDYDFKPREILEKICRIYINLGDSETNKKYREFCTAVSSDGRSYSENLLHQASEILFRTGLSLLGTEFEKLSQLVHKIAVRNQMDEIPTEDIPDTFLDPIMSTLMVDPVLLPSSKIIVDRSTIARHLLSDQTDPFNRSPLSMEDVIPETDLKNQISCFLKERREAQKQKLLRQDDSEDNTMAKQ